MVSFKTGWKASNLTKLANRRERKGSSWERRENRTDWSVSRTDWKVSNSNRERRE